MELSPDEKKSLASLDNLVSAIDKAYHQPKELAKRSFLYGLMSGLGATIGVAIVLALLAYLIRVLGGLPVIGQWLNELGRILPAGR